MSRRVSIALPDEAATAEDENPETAPASSPAKTPRSSLAPQSESDAKASAESNATVDSELVIRTFPEPFPDDDCERYKQDCCCCHCVAVRCALKRIEYLKTDEGQKRLQMKLHMKSFFMDINAMADVRQSIESKLYGTKELRPSSKNSFPISITNVAKINTNSISIDWYVHDEAHVAHYEIFVDNKSRKRVYSPNQTSTIVLDVDVKRTHKIRMKAVPKKGVGSNADAVDRLIRDACCGGLKKALKGDYFCQCGNKSKMENIEKEYKKNTCQTLVDFWKASEFLYIPVCSCKGDCDCDCFEN